MPRKRVRYLRRTRFHNLTDLLGNDFILLIDEQMDDDTRHVWRIYQRTALFKYAIKLRSAWPVSLAESANCSRLASVNGSIKSFGLLAKRLTMSRAFSTLEASSVC